MGGFRSSGHSLRNGPGETCDHLLLHQLSRVGKESLGSCLGGKSETAKRLQQTENYSHNDGREKKDKKLTGQPPLRVKEGGQLRKHPVVFFFGRGSNG